MTAHIQCPKCDEWIRNIDHSDGDEDHPDTVTDVYICPVCGTIIKVIYFDD